MSIKIESGIPAPVKKKRLKWPLASMKVGESFVYGNTLDYKEVNAARSLVNATNKRNDGEFVSGEHKGKVRIWRIK